MSLLPIPWLFTLQSNFFLFRRESEWILLWKLYSRLFPLFVMLCIAKFFFFLLHLAPLWLSLSSFHPLLFEGWTIYFFLSRKRKKNEGKVTKKFLSLFLCPFETKKTSCISLGWEILPYIHQNSTFFIFTLTVNDIYQKTHKIYYFCRLWTTFCTLIPLAFASIVL